MHPFPFIVDIVAAAPLPQPPVNIALSPAAKTVPAVVC
jgi:hypothetical protein